MKTLKTTLIYTFFASCLLATGCNTVQGVGEDLSSVGEATSDVASDAK